MNPEKFRAVGQEGIVLLGRAGRFVRRHAGYIVAGVGSSILAACASAPDSRASSGPPATTPTSAATQEATSTPEAPPTQPPATSTPEPTNTPELKLKFTNFGIYKGVIDEGGEILLAARPDDRMVVATKKTDISCTNPNVKPLTYFRDIPRDQSSFDFTVADGSGNRSIFITGNLKPDKTIQGVVGNDAYSITSATGSISCPATDFKYRAEEVGAGRNDFKDKYKLMYPGPTNPQLEAIFDRFLGK